MDARCTAPRAAIVEPPEWDRFAWHGAPSPRPVVTTSAHLSEYLGMTSFLHHGRVINAPFTHISPTTDPRDFLNRRGTGADT